MIFLSILSHHHGIIIHVKKIFRYIVTFARRDFCFCECRIVEGYLKFQGSEGNERNPMEKPAQTERQNDELEHCGRI